MRATIELEPVNTPDIVDIARALGTPIQAITEIVRIGADLGEIVRVGDNLLYTPSQLETLQRRTTDLTAGERFTPKQFREGIQTTRKYADALLSHFDETGFTERTTEGRICRSRT